MIGARTRRRRRMRQLRVARSHLARPPSSREAGRERETRRVLRAMRRRDFPRSIISHHDRDILPPEGHAPDRARAFASRTSVFPEITLGDI